MSGAEGARTVLFRIDEPILRVPQLAIHLDREISTEGLKLNKQEHMTPIWDLEGEAGSAATFLDTVAESADLDPATIVSWDAMVHDLTPSRRTGRNGVFLSAPRLDNLCSSFAAVLALVDVTGGQTPPQPIAPKSLRIWRAPAGSSVLAAPPFLATAPALAASAAVLAGRSTTSQCHQPDWLGASGSCTVMAKLFVPSGAPCHASAGDSLRPEQPKPSNSKCGGMAAPSVKSGLLRVKRVMRILRLRASTAHAVL